MSELQNNPHLNEISELPPKNYLVESILLTVLCCMPLGIVSLVYATKVNSAWEAGNKIEAQKASANAKKWVKWGFIAGFGFIVVFIGIYVLAIIGFITANGIAN